MEHIKEILLESLRKKSRTQEVLDVFSNVLKACAGAGTSEISIIARHAKPEQYQRGVLILSMPDIMNAPDLQYALQELKILLERETKKRISRIRLIPRS